MRQPLSSRLVLLNPLTWPGVLTVLWQRRQALWLSYRPWQPGQLRSLGAVAWRYTKELAPLVAFLTLGVVALGGMTLGGLWLWHHIPTAAATLPGATFLPGHELEAFAPPFTAHVGKIMSMGMIMGGGLFFAWGNPGLGLLLAVTGFANAFVLPVLLGP